MRVWNLLWMLWCVIHIPVVVSQYVRCETSHSNFTTDLYRSWSPKAYDSFMSAIRVSAGFVGQPVEVVFVPGANRTLVFSTRTLTLVTSGPRRTTETLVAFAIDNKVHEALSRPIGHTADLNEQVLAITACSILPVLRWNGVNLDDDDEHCSDSLSSTACRTKAVHGECSNYSVATELCVLSCGGCWTGPRKLGQHNGAVCRNRWRSCSYLHVDRTMWVEVTF